MESRRRSSRRRKRIRIMNAVRFIVALLVAGGLIGGAVLLLFPGGKPGVTTTQGPTTKISPTGTPGLPETLTAQADASAKPSNFGFSTNIMVNGNRVNQFERADKINFPNASSYTSLEGVITFRGNNYRSTASYGTVSVSKAQLTKVWEKTNGALKGDAGVWTGVGWTGQPLMVRWSDEMKTIMNLYPEKKTKKDLVEVILPTLDGHIYFFDLEDGSKTRAPVNLGVPFKGTASIDPRGYPILYAGQGDTVNGGSMQYWIVSLIDGKVLYKMPGKDPFSYRTNWTAFDSSALIDANSDTLVEPGENGVLYTIKLNTKFDLKAGTISIDPEAPVKYRYKANGDGITANDRWWGTENSAAGWRNYIFYTDNGGYMQCVDLNTMKLMWAQDVTDDSDPSIALEESVKDQTIYLYTACQVDKQKNAQTDGRAYIRKVNGLTGKIEWEKDYPCIDNKHTAGGVLASPVLGREGSDIGDLVIYPVGNLRTGGSELIAFDKNTGEEKWVHKLKDKSGKNEFYWGSSPVAVYDAQGKSYIIQCVQGKMLLIEGATGDLLDTYELPDKASVDASPSVFGNTIVIGTRSQHIYGIRID
ncbi:MAG: PQQ-binding-like beta-propeller repeat protein [Bacillota bacterium]